MLLFGVILLAYNKMLLFTVVVYICSSNITRFSILESPVCILNGDMMLAHDKHSEIFPDICKVFWRLTSSRPIV